jgi:PST family polysaccharide transporter
VQLLAFIGFPLSVFLHFSAEEIILLIFGKQWIASIPIFKILAWSIGIQVVLSSSGSVFQSANDTKRLFLAGFLSALLMITAISIGIFLFNSLDAVAYALLGAFSMNFFISYYFLIKKTLKQSLTLFFKQLFIPILIAIGVFVVEFLFLKYIKTDNIYLSLIVKTGIFVAILLPVLIKRFYIK